MNTTKQKLIHAAKKYWIIPLLIVAAFFIGRQGGNDTKPDTAKDELHNQAKDAAGLWTCSMHPQIKLPKPGKCPICFMDLIPLERDSDNESPGQLTLSEESKQLAEIRTTPVVRKNAYTDIRMVGKIDYDETKVKRITTLVSGRIERMYVDYTGISVKKGDHLFDIYSPELYTTQAEYLQAFKSGNQEYLSAAKKKLLLYGILESQIIKLEEKGVAEPVITIYSPMSGTVIMKEAILGTYVMMGMPIYTIADLSKVWAKLDAYESDIAWLRYGQKSEFTVQAFPGETFSGRIAFIDPVLNPETRTVKVRVNVENPSSKLKPDMLVTAVVKPKFTAEGAIVDESLAEKWICPMHPEVVKNGPGNCGICDMPLVKSESLGFGKISAARKMPLVIPASAPLVTGKRAVVYVEVKDTKKPTYEGREVVLGPKAGDFYIVKSGLVEGEMVVSNGAFRIDSELQIQAKPSLMNPEGGVSAPGHQHGAMAGNQAGNANESGHGEADAKLGKVNAKFVQSLEPAYSAYFKAQNALAIDNFAVAKESLADLLKKLDQVAMNSLAGNAHESWMLLSGKVRHSLEHLEHFSDIAQVREAFRSVSSAIIEIQKNFGHPGNRQHIAAFCPMAFGNKGGSWLQMDRNIMNPFFGKAMQKCGDIKEKFEPIGNGGGSEE